MSLPKNFFAHFILALNNDLGQDTVQVILLKAGLDAGLATPRSGSRLDADSVSQAYADVQAAIQSYFGRGARGILLRIGRLLWPMLLRDASFLTHFYAQTIRLLPVSLRLRPALELLAGFLRGDAGQVTIHSLDMDWMLADKDFAPLVKDARDSLACYITQGLIQECLFWACGREVDVAETSCRARGGDACEFLIKHI